MNIFFLSGTPKKCARYHVNKHVVKMILEYAQLLSTCWHVVDPNGIHFSPVYKKTHVNHPCAKWVRESSANYKWLCELAIELCHEYTYRYQKIHKTQEVIERLRENVPLLPSQVLTCPPQAMPEEYKVQGNAIRAYRKYYVSGKSHIHQWKNRDAPAFTLSK